MGSISQAVVVKEAVYASTIGTSTNSVSDVVLVGTKELSQTCTVKVCIGIDVFWRVHKVANTTEELLLVSEVFLRFGF